LIAGLAYALAWAAFGLIHSLLARDAVKARLRPRFGRAYRLVYNLFAGLCFAAVAWVGAVTLGGWPAFDLPAAVTVCLGGLHLTGWAVMIWAARHTDLGRLGGLAQLRGRDEDEPLTEAGPYRFSRHPLYLGGHLILWGLALSPLGLATAIFGSTYLLVGALFEERDLRARYGQPYDDYCRRVPFLFPRIR
jgi:protein-S-isoprenylcysteine O-methyltransferase Ste14